VRLCGAPAIPTSRLVGGPFERHGTRWITSRQRRPTRRRLLSDQGGYSSPPDVGSRDAWDAVRHGARMVAYLLLMSSKGDGLTRLRRVPATHASPTHRINRSLLAARHRLTGLYSSLPPKGTRDKSLRQPSDRRDVLASLPAYSPINCEMRRALPDPRL
jgi:hypothetical protein